MARMNDTWARVEQWGRRMSLEPLDLWFLGLRAGTLKATIEGQTLTVGGDVILQVQGIPLSAENSYERIQDRLSRLRSGAEVTITVLRAGHLVELKAKLP